MRSPRRPPPRVPIKFAKEDAQISVVLQEYSAIGAEVVATLSSQVATLSFGAATVGLLVASAANLWNEALVSSLILIFGVPLVCFLVLAIHSGEVIRLMRAGLFLHHLENDFNTAFSNHLTENSPPKCEDCFGAQRLLCWEHWGEIRQENDIDKLNRGAIFIVFYALALGFGAIGHAHLPVELLEGAWTAVVRTTSLLMAMISIVWLTYLVRRSISCRRLYDTGE